MRLTLAGMLIGWAAACARQPVAIPPPPPPEQPPPPPSEPFEATAYSIEGRTASGERSRPGIVAADPHVLPLGSRIRIEEAGRYSGEYTVSDTGRKINGRRLDIYIASDREARRFGRRRVRVQVIERASGK